MKLKRVKLKEPEQTPFGYWGQGFVPDRFIVELRRDMPFFQITDPDVEGVKGVFYMHHDKVAHFGTNSRIPVGTEKRSK